METSGTSPQHAASIQTSFRISPQTQAAIRSLADSKQMSQSEVMRAAVNYYQHIESADPNIKPAMVDISDCVGKRYRVKEWLISE